MEVINKWISTGLASHEKKIKKALLAGYKRIDSELFIYKPLKHKKGTAKVQIFFEENKVSFKKTSNLRKTSSFL
jgi:hypothetical protein